MELRFYVRVAKGVGEVAVHATGFAGRAGAVGQGYSDPRAVPHRLCFIRRGEFGVFDDLAFRVKGSTVTLLGATAQPVLKSDAEKAVKRVEGVTQVVNKIELLPVSPMDDLIRRAEYRAIYGDPALSDRYGFRAVPSIHIIVKNGHVTLEGVVANQADKTLINARANAVPNVFSVTNNLLVESEK